MTLTRKQLEYQISFAQRQFPQEWIKRLIAKQCHRLYMAGKTDAEIMEALSDTVLTLHLAGIREYVA